MIQQTEFTLKAPRRGLFLVTSEVLRNLPELPHQGILNLFIRHTSCALTINENADPDVRRDMDYLLDKAAPENDSRYCHTLEGADDMPAHFKSSLMGASLSIPIRNGRLGLGTWQGIYLCEFRDEAPVRSLIATIVS